MNEPQCDIGLIGLGVMGRNLALNIADRGFSPAGYDRDSSKLQALETEGKHLSVHTARNVDALAELVRSPKVFLMLVPAGKPVDDVIQDILPVLSSGDIVIDGGNSHFQDTDVRGDKLAERGIQFFGVGISGGERGARYGPSIMPGGPKDAYERVSPILEAIAARVDDEPCVTYLGPRSAGHYVKMVHNGIEYGLMQLLAETYHLMAKGLGCSDDELSEIYARWNDSDVEGFLVEITADIFRAVDGETGRRLVDVILDEAKQKGTGMWTSEDALQLHVPVPSINAGVEMRDLSTYKALREAEAERLSGPSEKFVGDKMSAIENVRKAFHTCMILTYAQGFALLARASKEYDYDLDLSAVARIWRGGCIIRSALLQDIMAAYGQAPDMPHLLADRRFSELIAKNQQGLRATVQFAARVGIPMPGIMAGLGYLDGLRSAWLPANLIQAQRDYFGAHSYERTDRKGNFHTNWAEPTDASVSTA